MGMYADVNDRQVKLSWPLSTAVAAAVGDERWSTTDDGYIELSYDDVTATLSEGYRMLQTGLKDIWSEPYSISGQYLIKVEMFASILRELMDWLLNDENKAKSISFG